MFIKIKTRDKIKCSQKISWGGGGGGGGNFHGGKLTPENAHLENFLPGNLAPISQRKKRKLIPEKNYLLGKI